MKKLLIAMAACAVLLNFNSCKKENKETTCRFSSLSANGVTYNYEYDAAGKIVKLSILPMGTYLLFTYTGSTMVQQGYDSTGTPSGSPRVTYLNSSGYIDRIYGSIDTSFYTYNADGRLISAKTGINASGGRSEMTYNQAGDIIQMVRYASDSSILRVSTYEMYTDRPNNTMFNSLISGEPAVMFFGQLGKPSAHYFKQCTISESGSTDFENFYWEFDANGYPTRLNVVTQPGNIVYQLNMTLLCSE